MGTARAVGDDLDRHARAHRSRVHLRRARPGPDKGGGRAPRLGGTDRRATVPGLRTPRRLHRRRICGRLGTHSGSVRTHHCQGDRVTDSVVADEITDEYMQEKLKHAKGYTLVLISQGPNWDTPD